MKNTRLPANLESAREEIEAHARAYGLDFFPIIYEVLDYRTLYETAAMGGFPTRYPHWRFGMDFDQLMKGHVWQGSTIYEMVINTNPSYAYLLEGNEDVTQKMVMAHVTGHVDFFKHNMWFAHTNRKMLDAMANHATRIQRIIDRIGYDVVEEFIDTCLSLENLIDYHSPYIKRPDAHTPQPLVGEEEPPVAQGLRVERDYMRDYINPPEYLAAQRQKIEDERAKQRRFPEHSQRDILLFLLNYAPLERWQHTVLEIVRDEAYYFAPQGMTKILNEGWASYWHSTIMTQKVASAAEIISFADLHSGVVATGGGRLNPYKLGLELLRDVEDRWNRGRFGKEYDECDDIAAKRTWDRQLGLGRQKIFEIRKLYNDVTFIDEFLTPEFVIENKLFTFRYNRDSDLYEIASREFKEIKEKLLFRLTNFGQPFISIEDGNYNNRGELYLRHRHEGVDLKMDYARDTMRNLQRIWTRPVHLETRIDDKKRLLSFDGSDYTERRID
ncbi:SpoVR family protein [Oscillochloris trichoides DG-6]|uniref:SpoVR family protein n=1 Tax=Oscillochloris trichoides DG-6 TaxID=765420 RepID=E1II83_9CHLR|nr:SpoVR family protein [Oscillochloris trichoides]EFO79111.1 SpoVR family protein [Oscillochloris trichoides DG-6]